MAHNGLADLILTGIRVLIEKGYCAQDQPRGAEAALDGAFFHERFLYGVEIASAPAKPLNGQNFLALGFDCEIKARVNWFAVQEYRAGAALPLLAGTLGPGQAQILPENFQQSAPRWDEEIVRLAVDPKRNGQKIFHALPPLDEARAFSQASLIARLVKVLISSRRKSLLARHELPTSPSSPPP